MVVDLPAPFGPRNPSTSPRCTVKLTPSTARRAPKRFDSERTVDERFAAGPGGRRLDGGLWG